jgi:putative phosphoesterase
LRIGLISDTHIPEAGSEIPRQAYEALAGVELILHAGDMHVIEVLDWLEAIAPVFGARGNGDGDGARPDFPDDDPRVKEAHVLRIEGLDVGLTHGFPLPEETPWTTLDDLMERKLGQKVDVIICGDTHVPLVCWREGVLFVNPGSPTLPRQILGLGQVGILTIEGSTASAEIIDLTQL